MRPRRQLLPGYYRARWEEDMVAASLAFLLRAQLAGPLERPLGSWSSWFLLDLTPVVAMAAFHPDAPLVPGRPWLLALPGYYLLVPVPVMVIQLTGNQAWLPDSAGLGCLVVSLACLAHAPRALSRSRRAPGSCPWSLALTLLAAVAGAWRNCSSCWPPSPWSSPTPLAPRQPHPHRHRIRAWDEEDQCRLGSGRAGRLSWRAC